MRELLLMGLSFLAVAYGIYPESHWTYSSELTTDNFDSFVKDNVDAGKTVMVRWIASEGWGWWRKQAPAWNTIVERFASNNDVVFGDINLSKQQIRGNHNPGAGGWPTIKYFNQATGYDGAPYEKKTPKSMCDELGDEEYMQAYVEEVAKTSLCSVTDPVNCSEKEVTYMEKWKTAQMTDISAELNRVKGMLGSKATPDQKKWISQRSKILAQLHTGEGDEL